MKKLLRIYPIVTMSARGARCSGKYRVQLAEQLIYNSFENALGVSRDALLSPSRKHEMVRCRIIASYISKNLLGLNWKQCGRILNRDHSTIIHDHNSHSPCYEQNYKEYQRYYQIVLGEVLKHLFQRLYAPLLASA